MTPRLTAADVASQGADCDTGTLFRHVTVTPGTCSGGSLIFAKIGDWTWEAVHAACGTNVYAARNSADDPVYLSFYYYHVRSEGSIHPYSLSFGDELEVTSRVFDSGTQSALTLHRIRKVSDADCQPLEPVEFYEAPQRDCMYVENLNRWVSRSAPETNTGLVNAAPADFKHRHLPGVDGKYSPRLVVGGARDQGSFYPQGAAGFARVLPSFTTSYDLDVARDINGVGLVYFASYFSIVDIALLRLWRQLGRTDRQFIRRRILDHRLGYFGNADINSRFSISVRLWRHERIPAQEIADVAIRDSADDRLIAVAGLRTVVEA